MYHLQSLFYLFSTAGSVAAYDHAFKYENESRKRLCAILRYLLKVLLIATFYESYFVNNRKKFLWNILLKETPLLILKKNCIKKNTTTQVYSKGMIFELSSWYACTPKYTSIWNVGYKNHGKNTSCN